MTTVCGGRASQPVDVVAAFEDRDQTGLGVTTGDPGDDIGQFGEVVVGQAELAQRVINSGVEAGRKAYLAGRIDVRREAIASSPVTDVPNPVATSS